MCYLNGASKSSEDSASQESKKVNLSVVIAEPVSQWDGIDRRVYSLRDRIHAWWLGIPVACLRFGHDIQRIDTGNAYFRKERQPKRDWYDGVITTCVRKKCPYEKFHGSPHPWKSDRAEISEEVTNAQS